MAMANHHDNLDMFDSKYQKDWNTTKVGPKKDIIGGWAKAAKNQNLPFGVSLHAAHAWSWYETSQRSDKTGQYAGVPYDGKLTKADGKGKWWDGLDPQDLYAQNHPLSLESENNNKIHSQWGWGNGVAVPTQAYIEKFVNRTIDLIDKYKPDVIYFDDSQLPFWPISDAGLRIAAYMYNKSISDHKQLRAVVNGKILDVNQRKALVWDIERGQSNSIEPFTWQTDTCIGGWHYDRSVYDRKRYKTAKTVVQSLIDIVSKNGNLLLNIPVRGDGSIDELERQIVIEIGRWMKVYSECIYGTRPFKVFGEGPAMENARPISAQGFNEGGRTAFTAADFRFTVKGSVLYAIGLAWPENGKVLIKSLSNGNPYRPETINKVELLGKGSMKFERKPDGLEVTLPSVAPEDSYAYALKIS
jgi:alpha-L-fucosidase